MSLFNLGKRYPPPLPQWRAGQNFGQYAAEFRAYHGWKEGSILESHLTPEEREAETRWLADSGEQQVAPAQWRLCGRWLTPEPIILCPAPACGKALQYANVSSTCVGGLDPHPLGDRNRHEGVASCACGYKARIAWVPSKGTARLMPLSWIISEIAFFRRKE